MDKDSIIQRGDIAKYQLTIKHTDFDQQRDDFFVVLHYGMACETTRICKRQMVHDEDGNWFMMFPTAKLPLGPVKAETHYMVPDTDVKGGVREEVEWDWLGFVTESPCPQFASRCHCQHPVEEHVKFKRAFRGDVNTVYMNLRTSDGEYLKDDEGNQLKVHKSEKELY